MSSPIKATLQGAEGNDNDRLGHFGWKKRLLDLIPLKVISKLEHCAKYQKCTQKNDNLSTAVGWRSIASSPPQEGVEDGGSGGSVVATLSLSSSLSVNRRGAAAAEGRPIGFDLAADRFELAARVSTRSELGENDDDVDVDHLDVTGCAMNWKCVLEQAFLGKQN